MVATAAMSQALIEGLALTAPSGASTSFFNSMTINETNNDKGFLAYLALQALEAHFAAQGLKFDANSDDIIHEALWDALDGVQVVSA